MGAAVVVLLAASGAVAVTRRDPSPYPTRWDQRVAPLARFVSVHRKLAWQHPITVEFLSSAAYHDAAVGRDTRSPTERKADAAANRHQAGEFRALGLVEGDVDLEAAGGSLADDGTLAFYDPSTKRAYVRGTALTPDVKETLVHELTHALQDQHFDLEAMQATADRDPEVDPQAVRALIEGDAMRVERAYYDQLSDHDAAAVDAADASGLDTLGQLRDEVPPALVDLFDAPYMFGGPFVEFLALTKGAAAVDQAFRDPPKTFAEVWDPFVYLDRGALDPVPELAAPAGGHPFDGGQLNTAAWYELLVQRVKPTDALAAVDGWAGDQFIAYTKGSSTCVDARFRGVTSTDADEMFAALQQWRAGRPATASVGRAGGLVTLHSCDPGTSATLGTTDPPGDLVVPAARSQVTLSVLRGLDSKPDARDLAFARCVGNRVVHRFSPQQLSADDAPDGFDQAMTSVATQCVDDPQGYPGAPPR